MNLRHLSQVVTEIAAHTPEPVANILKDVEVVIYRKPFGSMPSDTRGVYVGGFSPGIDDEISSEPPMGYICLFADNLVDKDEARDVFLHEIGHALGLDEHEVAGLGL